MIPAAKRQNAYSGRVVRKAARAGVVSLDEARKERVARVERAQTPAGQILWAVVIPTPGEPTPEHRLELRHWIHFPGLAEPLAHSILGIVRKRESSAGRTNVIYTAKYFKEYLSQTIPPERWNEFSLANVTTPLVNGFVKWLNRMDPSTNTEVLAVNTRVKALGTLRMIIEEARRGNWAKQVPGDLAIPERVWPGFSRQHTPTEIIPLEAFSRIYQACVAEVTETMEKYENGQRLIEATRSLPPDQIQRKQAYSDLGIRLATINAEFPTLLPRSHSSRDTSRSVRILTAAIVMYGGIKAHAPYFYPSPRALVPFALLLAIHTAYNTATILPLEVHDVREVDIFGEIKTSFEPPEDDSEVPQKRTRFAGPKGRSRNKRQKRTTPVTSDPDNPAVLLKFLRRWTARIRPIASPHEQSRVLLFLPEVKSRTVVGFGSTRLNAASCTNWQLALKNFQEAHGLQKFTLREIRSSCLDQANLVFNGDLRAMLVVGGEGSMDVVNQHYTSDGARQRNDERLGGAVNLMLRDRANHGRSDARRASELGVDLGAATPGWGCLDPYESPIPGQVPGRLCQAYGLCPICPLAQINPKSPLSCYYAYDLLARIDEAREELGPGNWLQKWGPVRTKLSAYWLPLFSNEVSSEAEGLQLRRIPPVT
jgi:hypothetical protein